MKNIHNEVHNRQVQTQTDKTDNKKLNKLNMTFFAGQGTFKGPVLVKKKVVNNGRDKRQGGGKVNPYPGHDNQEIKQSEINQRPERPHHGEFNKLDG